MRAVVVREFAGRPAVEMVPDPEPPPGGVLS
jgi:D-arabinose 1-dehydrogenase-like Zn-dependent alcohol dehydrogenase